MDLQLALIVLLGLVLAALLFRQERMGRQLRRVLGDGATPPGLGMLQREILAVRSGLDGWARQQVERADTIGHRLGRLQKATEDVERLGDELQELGRILRPARLRGAWGERLLEDLLLDLLPRDRFRVQYTYPNSGARVDAAVLLGDGRLLAIDSKFPLDNFRRYVDLRGADPEAADSARRAFARDVRRHVDQVAEKYLAPREGSLDVAFMYVPSEAVYQQLALWDSDGDRPTPLDYALRRRVVPVSPNTLHAYLAVVRMGLRGFRLDRDARELLTQLEQIDADVEALRSELDTALKQARHSLDNLSDAERALRRVEFSLSAIRGLDAVEGARGGAGPGQPPTGNAHITAEDR